MIVVGRFVFGLTNRADRQTFFGERGLWQLAGGGERIDFTKPSFQTLGLVVAPVLETIGDNKAQFVRLAPVREASRGSRKSSKARKARLPSTQTSPDCSRSRSPIMTATS